MRVIPISAIPMAKFTTRRPTPVSFSDMVEELSKKAYLKRS